MLLSLQLLRDVRTGLELPDGFVFGEPDRPLEGRHHCLELTGKAHGAPKVLFNAHASDYAGSGRKYSKVGAAIHYNNFAVQVPNRRHDRVRERAGLQYWTDMIVSIRGLFGHFRLFFERLGAHIYKDVTVFHFDGEALETSRFRIDPLACTRVKLPSMRRAGKNISL
jgi:hypothetical protein